MTRLGQTPHVALPGEQVLAEPDTRFPFHDFDEGPGDLRAAGQAEDFKSHRQE